MGFLTGKPKEPRKPVTCNQCRGKGEIARPGLQAGGTWVRVATDPCPSCNGRGTL